MNGGRYFATRKNGQFQRGEISRHNAQRPDEFREMGVANRFFQPAFYFFSAKKPLPWQDEWINQLQQSPPILHFAGESLHRNPVVAESPDRSDVSAHAAAGDDVNFNSIFFQHLDDTDVRQAARTPRGQSQSDSAMPRFTRQAADVGVKVFIRPTGELAHGGSGGTAMNEPMHRTAHLFEQLVKVFLALFPANNRAEINSVAPPVRAHLTEEQVAMIQIL